MNDEVVAVAKPMTRKEAVGKIKKANQLLDSMRPASTYDMEAYPESVFLTVSAFGLGIIFGLFGIANTLVYFLEGNALSALTSLGVTVLSSIVAGGVASIQMGNSYVGDPKQKIRGLLKFVLATKKQRAWFAKHQNHLTSKEKVNEAYNLLVDRLRGELEQKHVFEIANNLEDPEVDKIFFFDEENKKIEYISKETHLANKQRELNSNPSKMSEKIVARLLDNRDLID